MSVTKKRVSKKKKIYIYTLIYGVKFIFGHIDSSNNFHNTTLEYILERQLFNLFLLPTLAVLTM